MEYKFRGKRDDTGEWVYGNLVRIIGNGFEECHITSFTAWEDNDKVDPDTVRQYTGLHDKADKEIFEGDVVQCWGGEYCQGYWEHSTRDIVTSDPYLLVALSEYEHVEIIGNIHDNPELLQEATP